MREIVSPLSGLRSPVRKEDDSDNAAGKAADALLGSETVGLAIDFRENGYTLRT